MAALNILGNRDSISIAPCGTHTLIGFRLEAAIAAINNNGITTKYPLAAMEAYGFNPLNVVLADYSQYPEGRQAIIDIINKNINN